MKIANYSSEPLINEEELKKRIEAIGKAISRDFQGQSLIVVGVLKGSFIFLADLVRQVNLELKVEFIGVKSYEGTESTGHVQITTDLTSDIKGQNVLLVEDIVDTGMTLDFLINTLRLKQPKTLKTCALLSKPEAHVMKNPIDYVGFEISNEFVVGYGLDLNGLYRNIPYIAQIKPD